MLTELDLPPVLLYGCIININKVVLRSSILLLCHCHSSQSVSKSSGADRFKGTKRLGITVLKYASYISFTCICKANNRKILAAAELKSPKLSGLSEKLLSDLERLTESPLSHDPVNSSPPPPPQRQPGPCTKAFPTQSQRRRRRRQRWRDLYP